MNCNPRKQLYWFASEAAGDSIKYKNNKIVVKYQNRSAGGTDNFHIAQRINASRLLARLIS